MFFVSVLTLAGSAAALGPGPNGLALVPPMGWMSWEIFRCETDCAKFPTKCISADLYTETADAMAGDGYLAAGYSTVSIDDCWEADDGPRKKGAPLTGDPKRFPDGMKAVGDHLHGKGVRFGIYSDEGSQTCGGFPGSEGYEKMDADTFASWGVDYLKLDGCYNTRTGFVTGYPAMGTALQSSGRNIVYSCSWPAYLGGNETAKPWAAMIAAGCNSWRNWEDIDCGWSSLVQIIDHWGEFGPELAHWAGPGHWHDPDMLLIGNGCLTTAEEQTQMALWSISAAPLIMGNDLRNVAAASKAILQNNEAIAVDQDPLGKMGYRVNVSADGHGQVWGRALSGGAIAVGAYNKGGGTPAGVRLVEAGAYCTNATGVDNHSSFGYTLATCAHAVATSPRCLHGKDPHALFYYSEGYNGQCTCPRDDCARRNKMQTYSIYELSPGSPALGADVTVDFVDLAPFTQNYGGVGAGESAGYEVFDIWAGKSMGSFTGSFTAKNVPMHGTGFFKLTAPRSADNRTH